MSYEIAAVQFEGAEAHCCDPAVADVWALYARLPDGQGGLLARWIADYCTVSEATSALHQIAVLRSHPAGRC
jgi:hypothetical protein